MDVSAFAVGHVFVLLLNAGVNLFRDHKSAIQLGFIALNDPVCTLCYEYV